MLLSAGASEFLTRISAKLIYGTIILGAVLGSISDPLPGNLRVIVTVLLSLYAVSIANAYARTIDADMVNKRATPWGQKWRQLLRPSWVMSSTVVPVTFFGLALAGLVTEDTALRATKVGLLVLLLFFGVISRRLSGAAMLPSILAGIVVALVGYVVVQLKLWTKYLPAFGF